MPDVQLNPQQQETLKRAREASERQNYDYAINLLLQLVRDVPDDIFSRRLLRANELLKIKSASAFDKVKIQPLVLKGSSCLKKDPAEAMSIAEDILAIDPRSEQGNNLLAEASEALNLPEVAILALETLRDAKPSDVDNLKALGHLYLKFHQNDKALKIFDAALKIKPNDGAALKGMKDASALQASKQGAWEENLDYRQSLKSGDESAAIEQASKVVKSVEAIDQQLLALSEQYQQNPQNLSVVIKIADLYERKEDLAGALQWFEYAYITLTKQADPELEKRINKIRTVQMEEALAAKRHEMAAAPADSQPALQSELTVLEQQFAAYRFQRAKDLVARYPQEKTYRFELGRALVEAGDFRTAIPELQEGAKQPNVRHQALNTLGTAFWRLKMYDFAIKQFQTAESELPVMDNIKKEVVYNLGCVLEDFGKKDESLVQFKKIYEFDSKYRDVERRVMESYGH